MSSFQTNGIGIITGGKRPWQCACGGTIRKKDGVLPATCGHCPPSSRKGLKAVSTSGK